MERLFSPWRSQYIASISKGKQGKKERCLFCDVMKSKNDSKNYILFRNRHCFAMMNLYPYNSGHVMIIPYTHTADLGRLTKEEYTEIMSATAEIVGALGKAVRPDGFNLGANLGRVAGAGIDRHIHFHVVPRWAGDTNFMPTLADTRVVSEAIGSTYRKLKKFLPSEKSSRF